MNQVIIGIDPGDRWNGIAVLHHKGEELFLRSAVFDNPSGYPVVDWLRDFVTVNSDVRADVVVEDYRIRDVGHQRNAMGHTLRVIGALQYTCLRYGVLDWNTVPAADPIQGLRKCGLDNIIEWVTSKGDHELSAWRVIAYHLMRTNPDLLLAIRDAGEIRDPKYDPPLVYRFPWGSGVSKRGVVSSRPNSMLI